MAGQLLGCSVAWLVRFVCLVFSTITKVLNKSHMFGLPPWKCLGSHDHDTFIRNVGGPYHPPFWRCHKPRAGLSNIKRREGGAGGERSASPRKASHGHDTFIRNVGGPYHPPFWRCHKPRGEGGLNKKAGGGRGGRAQRLPPQSVT